MGAVDVIAARWPVKTSIAVMTGHLMPNRNRKPGSSGAGWITGKEENVLRLKFPIYLYRASTGCQLCIDACPYDCIFYNSHLQLAQKCTGCAHLVDREAVFAGRCADVCFHEAIQFGDESSLNLSDTETLYPEYNLKTRAHYKNLPKRFVAGTVYDPSNNEVVIGASCSISGTAGSKSAETDEFGDFWLEELGEGAFTLTISGNGKTKTITGDTTNNDVGLGDIALT
jgi:formate hydrogenlyase subunit 6/NADH:ubiquinone oxidoreductase subunit I